MGFIKVQKDEVDAIDDFTVPFADGSGYLVTVDVFHQLHCLVSDRDTRTKALIDISRTS